MEGFRSAAFTKASDDLYYLTRVRLNVTVTPRKGFMLQAQGQDAFVGDKTVGPTRAPFSGSFDLRTGFGEMGAPSRPLTVRAGRQELAYGDQRLLGHLSWTNTARTFDGIKVTARSKRMWADVFATSLVRILPGEFDKSGNGNRVAGAYASTAALVPKAVVEPYIFWRRDTNLRAETGSFGSLTQVTGGVRFVGRLPGALDFNIEMVRQGGSLASDSVNAWAGHWQLRSSLPVRWTPHVFVEYNVASGDEDPSDGRRGTFDQLYPTGHEKYGLADQVGWRNIRDLHLGVDLTPLRSTVVTANYHSYWLEDTRDGLYNAGGALIARVAAGAASGRVGQEVDLQVARPLTPQIQIAGGWAHLVAGDFLKQATPGADYGHGYLMVTYVFLAEK